MREVVEVGCFRRVGAYALCICFLFPLAYSNVFVCVKLSTAASHNKKRNFWFKKMVCRDLYRNVVCFTCKFKVQLESVKDSIILSETN